jgi:hypothetical protein
MALLAAVIVLEVWVATRVPRWRIQFGRGMLPDSNLCTRHFACQLCRRYSSS